MFNRCIILTLTVTQFADMNFTPVVYVAEGQLL